MSDNNRFHRPDHMSRVFNYVGQGAGVHEEDLNFPRRARVFVIAHHDPVPDDRGTQVARQNVIIALAVGFGIGWTIAMAIARIFFKL